MDYTKLSQSIYQQEKSLTRKEQNRVVIRKRFCNALTAIRSIYHAAITIELPVIRKSISS